MKQKKGQVKFISADKSTFFPTLKERVDRYFVENKISKNFNASMVIKSIVLVIAYIVPLVLVMLMNPPFWLALLCWSVMGIAMAGIGMSVMHDANHGAYTSNSTINRMIGFSLNICGGATFNWKLQHNILHHTYTNITGLDDDIDEKLGMRFSPHTRLKKFQRFQFIYAFLLYGIVTLYWVTLKDFIQFIRYTKDGTNPNSKSENFVTMLQIIAIKICYFFAIFFVPVYFFAIPFYQVMLGFLLMHFIAGIILSTVFQLAHTVDGTSHPMPNEHGTIENNWAIHQLNTTANFSRSSKWISWYVGGLNFQVEHHLFPKICHVHYPEIAHIVKETAEEYGIPYLESTTFRDALQSHIKTLKRFGTVPPLDEIVAG